MNEETKNIIEKLSGMLEIFDFPFFISGFCTLVVILFMVNGLYVKSDDLTKISLHEKNSVAAKQNNKKEEVITTKVLTRSTIVIEKKENIEISAQKTIYTWNLEKIENIGWIQVVFIIILIYVLGIITFAFGKRIHWCVRITPGFSLAKMMIEILKRKGITKIYDWKLDENKYLKHYDSYEILNRLWNEAHEETKGKNRYKMANRHWGMCGSLYGIAASLVMFILVMWFFIYKEKIGIMSGIIIIIIAIITIAVLIIEARNYDKNQITEIVEAYRRSKEENKKTKQEGN